MFLEDSMIKLGLAIQYFKIMWLDFLCLILCLRKYSWHWGPVIMSYNRVTIPSEEIKRKATRQSIVFFVHPDDEVGTVFLEHLDAEVGTYSLLYASGFWGGIFKQIWTLESILRIGLERGLPMLHKMLISKHGIDFSLIRRATLFPTLFLGEDGIPSSKRNQFQEESIPTGINSEIGNQILEVIPKFKFV